MTASSLSHYVLVASRTNTVCAHKAVSYVPNPNPPTGIVIDVATPHGFTVRILQLCEPHLTVASNAIGAAVGEIKEDKGAKRMLLITVVLFVLAVLGVFLWSGVHRGQ